MNDMEVLRFLRALPRNANGRTPLWMVAGASGPRMTAAAAANGVRIADTSRLRVLEQLVPNARSVAVYADDAQQSCARVLDFGGHTGTVCG